MIKRKDFMGKHNIKLLVITLLTFIAVLSAGENFQLIRAANPCVMDGARMIMNGAIFLILYLVHCFYVIMFVKESLDIQKVLRMTSKKNMWYSSVVSLFLINGIVTIFWIALGAVNGRIYSGELLNWSEQGSFFSHTTKPVGVTADVSVLAVVLVSFIVIMLILDIISLVILGSYWLTGNFIWGLLIIFATGFYDTWATAKPLFLKQFIVYSNEWANKSIIIENIVCLIILLLCFVMVGSLMVEKKEFLNETKERK